MGSGTQQGSQYKIGAPYQINGVWYYPKENFSYDETGIASWYGPKFHGRRTANGERYDMTAISAAHRTLPLPSIVRVTNLQNGRSLVVRVNDRGPYARGRIIDVSRRAAQLLGFLKKGTARVRVQVMAKESRQLAARLRGGKGGRLAKGDSPIIVDKLPKPTVVSENLLPPREGREAERTSPLSPVRIASAPPPSHNREGAPRAPHVSAPPDLSPRVSVVGVEETKIFVQAGAFANFENANRVRANLTGIAPIKVTTVLIGGRDLFRVRLGPLKGVGDADKVLNKVIEAGYNDAKTIVDGASEAAASHVVTY
ncbi:septal ring lytic transglycosylase RlpA family protein [Varunaivibrio sulfuroxidans]|nr:septal ring lytic transglycosylase RlpA family protein [Varunaivibrio sulfuroxidans]WES32254.1 septal ring lytic transglycosylase RlpA family protein [Varunaivibrio sulfuroxidans]